MIAAASGGERGDPDPADPALPEIYLSVEDDGWEEIPDLEALCARGCGAAFTAAGVDARQWAVSILLTGDDDIARLNLDHRGKLGPTNVLSWPAQDLAPEAEGAVPPAPDAPFLLPGEDAAEIGDLALALGVCTREAAARGVPLSHHVTHLLLHGTLHCLGYDHICDGDAALMERLETESMRAMGLHDPYEDGLDADGPEGGGPV